MCTLGLSGCRVKARRLWAAQVNRPHAKMIPDFVELRDVDVCVLHTQLIGIDFRNEKNSSDLDLIFKISCTVCLKLTLVVNVEPHMTTVAVINVGN